MVRAGVTVDSGEVEGEGAAILRAKYTGPHALRHFYASWLINRKEEGGLGLTAKMVQEPLGHASIVVTMDLYMCTATCSRAPTMVVNWPTPRALY